MRSFKRVLCLLLAVCLAAGLLTGCSGGGDGQRLTAELHVYKCNTTDTKLDSMADSFNCPVLVGDKLYVYAYRYTEDGEDESGILCANLDGSDAQKLQLQFPRPDADTNSGWISGILSDNNGGLYILEQVNMPIYADGGSEGQGEPIDWQNQYWLYRLEIASGSITSGVQLQMPEGVNWLNAERAACGADGTCYFSADSNVLVVSPDGNVRTVDLLKGSNGYIDGVFNQGDQVIVHWYGGDNWQQHYTPLAADGRPGEDLSLPDSMRNANAVCDSQGKLYFHDENGIYGYNEADGSAQLLCSWLDSDIDYSNEIRALFANDDGSFTAIGYGENWDKLLVSDLSYVDPSTLPEKTILTLACMYSWNLQRAVLQFNRASDTVRITLVDYSSYNNEENQYTGAETQLNNDIVTGRVPDILSVDSSLPFDSYTAKGLFTDLNPLLDADANIDRADLLENVLQLTQDENGHLNSIIPNFDIATVVGATETVGSQPGWTWEEFYAMMEQHPDVQNAFANMTRSNMLLLGLFMGGQQFVDYKNGTCSFDSDGFQQLLEYAATYPKDENYEYQDVRELIASGKALLQQTSLYDFGSIRQTVYDMNGPITFKGYPTADGSSGSAVLPSMQFAISENCPDKEAAWQFISYFLDQDKQEGAHQMMMSLPLSKTALQEMATEAMTSRNNETYYGTADGGMVVVGGEAETEDTGETSDTGETTDDSGTDAAADGETTDGTDAAPDGEGTVSVSDGESVSVIGGTASGFDDLTPLDYWNRAVTQEEVDQMMALIQSADTLYQYDREVMNIVQEEAKNFFEGTKSAAEIADIIQNRVSTYLSESR